MQPPPATLLAVTQDLPHEADVGRQAKAEQAYPPMVSHEDRQHN